ncbi:charged multivesicular body protein 7 isoform X6 [Poecile atricapillus]|uniref:charged multivesicular body protein 7 isoform X6 n=1 Tax=Poecile atricapillus TaxID=48891 RepID=UPI00273A40E0|nr:charged multivesicular body protein 7 isoform X6 [Poecile atricapillus]
MCSPGEAPPGLAPAGDLPPEWETDDERMAFLFSAFKQSREVNSTEWDSKMAFWVGLVLARGRRRGAVRTCLRELQNGFERRGSVPLGLGTVLRELLRRGKLQRESDFMASVDSSWISWGVGVFILKPLKWTLSSVLGDSKIPEEEEVLIYVELLQIVKFARGLHAKVSPMNDVDIGVYQLMQSEQLLSQKVESLSQEAEKCKEDARSACRAGKKQLALRCLKSKRRTERRIEELHSKLDAVQGILDRIYASQTDQMVFNAYQAGVGALKLSMKDVTVERAENLVDQIQELCDTQDEVAQTLAGVGINGLAEVDSEELEKELDSLLQDSSKDSVDLPPVPQMVPSARVSDAELEAELEQLSVSAGDLAQKTPSASSEPKTALGLNL